MLGFKEQPTTNHFLDSILDISILGLIKLIDFDLFKTLSFFKQHDFITRHRSPHVIMDLITRTKKAVRDYDNVNYRKMKKILIYETESLPDVEGKYF